MKRSRVLLLLVVLCGVAVAAAGFVLTTRPDNRTTQPAPADTALNGADGVVETVGVKGSSATFPVSIDSTIGGKQQKLNLTGTALRERFLINVYTVGSYLQDGVAVTTADDLVSQDCSKQLHLKMETSVSGKQMADALVTAVRKSHPKPEFDAEIASLSQQLQTSDIAKGGQVWLTNVPGVGLTVNVVGKPDIKIESPAFAKAIWGVYLGKNNLGEPIKAGLVSRLK